MWHSKFTRDKARCRGATPYTGREKKMNVRDMTSNDVFVERDDYIVHTIRKAYRSDIGEVWAHSQYVHGMHRWTTYMNASAAQRTIDDPKSNWVLERR